MEISAKIVKELRDQTGAGMMNCKQALKENDGDFEKALKALRLKGMATADKKSSRAANEGIIDCYIHTGSKLGIMIEVNCETDFVARRDEFKELVKNVAMQIASNPEVDIVSTDDISDEIRNQEWVCLSIVTPELVKNCKVRAIKIRGTYATEEEAKRRCAQLNKKDPYFNIYIAQVGVWVPWCDDPEQADDVEYSNKELNKIMKAYKNNIEQSKELHEMRKNDFVKKTVNEVSENNSREENKTLKQQDAELENMLDSKKEALEKKETQLNEVKEVRQDILDELQKAKELYAKMEEKMS